MQKIGYMYRSIYPIESRICGFRRFWSESHGPGKLYAKDSLLPTTPFGLLIHLVPDSYKMIRQITVVGMINHDREWTGVRYW